MSESFLETIRKKNLVDKIADPVFLAMQSLDLGISVVDAKEIQHLIEKSVLFEGKRFRPLLCFLMGSLLGLPATVFLPYARAAELVHAATLSHDDVIDEGDKRRGRPTLRVQAQSNAKAVLIGDLLLSRVMFELSELGHLSIIQSLAMTVEQLVTGEWLQLSARGNLDVSLAHLNQVAEKKTASLMVWCCSVPSFFTQRSEFFLGLCQEFGELLGVAFQMVDDVLDFSKTSQKPFAQDLKEGLVNFVSVHLLSQNPDLYQPMKHYLAEKKDIPWSEQQLFLAVQSVKAIALKKVEKAEQILDQIYEQAMAFSENKVLTEQSYESLKGIVKYFLSRSN